MGGVRGREGGREAGDRVWIRSERALERAAICGGVASDQKTVTIAKIILLLTKKAE